MTQEATPAEESKTEELVKEANPVDQAAMSFYHLIPSIKTSVHGMSLRQLQRVIIAAAEFPLADKYPKFVSKKETELFMSLLHAEALKNIMKEAVMHDRAELENLAVNGIVEEVITKNNEEKGE